MYFDEDEKWMINFNEEGEENKFMILISWSFVGFFLGLKLFSLVLYINDLIWYILGVDLFMVVVYEFGYVLGLSYSNELKVLMYLWY